LFVFFFAIGRPLPLAAQAVDPASVTVSWTRTNPGGGGALHAVGAGPTGIIVVGSDLSGAYLSRDRGQSWEPIGAANGLIHRFGTSINAVGFDPQDGNILYLGSNDGIYRSSDGGRQFQRVQSQGEAINNVNGEVYTVNGFILDIKFAPSTPSIGYTAWHPFGDEWMAGLNARQGQVFKTLDRGLTWQRVSNSTLPNTVRITKLIVHPTNPGLIYLLSGKSRFVDGDPAVYRSQDGGVNWQKLAPTVPRILDLAIDKSVPNRLYLTTEDVIATPQDCIAWDAPLADRGKLYRSENGGNSWTKVADRTGLLWVDVDDPQTVRLVQPDHQHDWNDDCSGLWESVDRGVTWARVSDQRTWGRSWFGFDNNYWWSFEPLHTLGEDLSDPDTWLWADGFFYATFDNGRTWASLDTKQVAPGLWRSTGLENVVMFDLAVSPADNNQIYVGYYDIGCWHSPNRGASWENCTLPDPGGYTDGRKGWGNFTIVQPDPTRPAVLWGATTGEWEDPGAYRLLRSEDYGKNWQTIPTPPGLMAGLAVDATSPATNRTLFVTIGEDVYRSQDDGRTWALVYDCNGCWFTAVDRFVGSRVYAGGEAGVFYSTQGGAPGTWQIAEQLLGAGSGANPWGFQEWSGVHALETDPHRPNWVYATLYKEYNPDDPTTNGGLYRSQDGGASWNQLLPDAYRYYTRDVAISPLDPNVLYVTSSSSSCCGAYIDHSVGVLRSTDGGATWVQVNEGMAWPFARSIAVVPSTMPGMEEVWVGSPGTGVQNRLFPVSPPPPAAPSNLQALTVSNQQINLTWRDNANNESGFNVERCQGNSCTNFSELFTTNANVRSYVDRGLTANTAYCYRVRAVNGSSASAYSNTACRTTGPLPPTSLTANRILATEVNLFWVETAINESGFKLQRCTGATCTNFAQIVLLPANVIGYHDTGLTANTTYRYRVAAYTADGNSAYSAIRTITTAAATVASAEESNPATETIPAETAIFAVQPQSQLALTTQVACFNQRQPTAVHLWAGEQSVPMTTTSPQGDLYQATLLVNDQFSDTLDYPLSVHWQCAGIEEPLVEYLGIMQVRVASEEQEGATRNFLPIVVQADK
jgi:photosystem II stability/assembly factor-like uncharacterized protein